LREEEAVVMRAELEECGGAVVILPTSLPTEGWTATVLIPTSQHRMQEKAGGFLVVWGFPRW